MSDKMRPSNTNAYVQGDAVNGKFELGKDILERAKAYLSHVAENSCSIDCCVELLQEAMAEVERLRFENSGLLVAVLGPEGIRANQDIVIREQNARIKELESAWDLCQNELAEFRKGKDAHKVISDLMEYIGKLEQAFLEAYMDADYGHSEEEARSTMYEIRRADN